jgi:hypothetical protein
LRLFPFVHRFLSFCAPFPFIICIHHRFSFSLSNKVFAHFFQCALLCLQSSLCERPPFLSLVRTTYVF